MILQQKGALPTPRRDRRNTRVSQLAQRHSRAGPSA